MAWKTEAGACDTDPMPQPHMKQRTTTDLTEPVAGEEYEHDGRLVDVVEVGMEYVKVDYLSPSYEDARWIDRAIVETEFVRTEPSA